MNETEQYLQALLEKEKWTDEECRWMLHYLEHTPASELKTLLLERYHAQQPPVDEALRERLLAGIHDRMLPPARIFPLRRVLVRVAAAAAILIAGAGIWAYQHRPSQPPAPETVAQQPPHTDAAPAGNKATLVLASGKTVLLDETADGYIDGGSLRKQNAELVYEDAPAAATNAYNTLITPRGGQYRVQLPDGSRVWLNAGSTLKYPVSFGKDRTVALTGEAYFEVAKDAARPFAVTVNNMTVQVLGTSFNVSAYNDEPAFTTTLLEGAVRVVSGDRKLTLAPGQQSVLQTASGRFELGAGDTDGAMAWKNGLFSFRNAELSAVMRQISRWYDVDVEFDRKAEESIHVTGNMRRQENLAQVLKILELTAGVHFTVSGKTVKVTI
ncbi:FecR family protein [Chitinophaga lutea]